MLLLVLDASEPLNDEDRALMRELRDSHTPVWIAFNKIDLAPRGRPTR